ncbi:MAG: hypothetical protein AB7O28_20015 [Vicinamibacterales bacterium]
MANSLHSIAASATQRTTSRLRVAVQARLTWTDKQTGAIRFASAVTRDVSDTGAFVECPSAAPLPLFRLVHLQLEGPALHRTHPLSSGRVLAAVWRVEHDPTARDSRNGYALRFLIDPAERTAAPAAHRPARAAIAAAC